MSLARAFTKRGKRPEISLPATTPARATSIRNKHGPIKRAQISGPLELKSTTNVLVFSHPDIHSTTSPSHSCVSSPSDSDLSHGILSSPNTSPEPSVIELSSPGSANRMPTSDSFSKHSTVSTTSSRDMHSASHSLKHTNTSSQEFHSHSDSPQLSVSSQHYPEHYHSSKGSDASSRDYNRQRVHSKHSASSSRDIHDQYDTYKHTNSSSHSDYFSQHPSSVHNSRSQEFHGQPSVPEHPSQSTRDHHHRQSPSIDHVNAPVIPQRAPSHTKRTHILSRQRSVSKTELQSNGMLSNPNGSSTGDSFKSSMEAPHPFGKELEQVREVAEGFGLKEKILSDEEQMMISKGLQKFRVEEYRILLEDLYVELFNEGCAVGNSWI
ncbi:MAG: hypothetical protein M1834_002690 [Cirrosporium novae-zelandiae]|nr:MAG: hypothetical protein M1834_002690 [Cirrosporium novae-zelandiae]